MRWKGIEEALKGDGEVLKSNVEALKGDDNELKCNIKALGDFFLISWLTKQPSHENAKSEKKKLKKHMFLLPPTLCLPVNS